MAIEIRAYRWRGRAVLRNMGQVTKLHKKRVEQAAFLVLKSPDMPSILVNPALFRIRAKREIWPQPHIS